MKELAQTDQKILGIIEFEGTIILCTESGVYRLIGDEFQPAKINHDPIMAIVDRSLEGNIT